MTQASRAGIEQKTFLISRERQAEKLRQDATRRAALDRKQPVTEMTWIGGTFRTVSRHPILLSHICEYPSVMFLTCRHMCMTPVPLPPLLPQSSHPHQVLEELHSRIRSYLRVKCRCEREQAERFTGLFLQHVIRQPIMEAKVELVEEIRPLLAVGLAVDAHSAFQRSICSKKPATLSGQAQPWDHIPHVAYVKFMVYKDPADEIRAIAAVRRTTGNVITRTRMGQYLRRLDEGVNAVRSSHLLAVDSVAQVYRT